ncbi:putative porin [Pseudooceanicola batsensis HTCC2597]|uniref:Putative porin n=1 Tax=Pseudooceanicola batsensis (strain ATCC BAA-863 / DSM 15984 / KCTC 12145 / HTCC2597) TaxID=252305 RepID=A3TW76_PSEBH|nr:porin [Pseudooceanicola batsensis]EAQ03872.1 putative porin [Pseudooceanicola batsensis HTCC2597]
MKKILFATTALVATAGVAAADVSISGRAAFGLDYTDAAGAASVTELRTSADLYFTGTTETDGGVTLSATVEMEGLNYNAGFAKGGNVGATTVFSASAGALTFTFGNTDGAFDKSMGEVHRIAGIWYELWGGIGTGGSLFIDNSDPGNIARIDYAAGPVSVSLSYAGVTDSVGIGAKYSGDMGAGSFYVAAAYESDQSVGGTDDAYYGLSAGGTFGAFEARVAMVDGDNYTDPTFNISAAYNANGLMVGANYLFTDAAGRSDDWTIFGTYDLGGGASLFAQYGERNTTDRATMGVAFSF